MIRQPLTKPLVRDINDNLNTQAILKSYFGSVKNFKNNILFDFFIWDQGRRNNFNWKLNWNLGFKCDPVGNIYERQKVGKQNGTLQLGGVKSNIFRLS